MELIVSGRRAYAYSAGHAQDANKPSIVFVHGAGLDHSSWALQSRYFAYHGWNVLALDLPAHGRSEGPALQTIEAIADWLVALLDAAGVERATLAGHSMGSLAALECAARHPARVERVALIGTAFPMTVAPGFLEAARRNETAAYDMETIWGHAPQAPLSGDPSPGMWMYGDMLARLARLSPDVLYRDLKACNDYAAGLASAAKLQCPALLVLGERDAMTPVRQAGELARTIRGARVVTLPRAGHSLMVEAPDGLLAELKGFLGERLTA
jgi:pimeloyl-ACP methyl ester carboxylesterase